jgi:hypothetical protein
MTRKQPADSGTGHPGEALPLTPALSPDCGLLPRVKSLAGAREKTEFNFTGDVHV